MAEESGCQLVPEDSRDMAYGPYSALIAPMSTMSPPSCLSSCAGAPQLTAARLIDKKYRARRPPRAAVCERVMSAGAFGKGQMLRESRRNTFRLSLRRSRRGPLGFLYALHGDDQPSPIAVIIQRIHRRIVARLRMGSGWIFCAAFRRRRRKVRPRRGDRQAVTAPPRRLGKMRP